MAIHVFPPFIVVDLVQIFLAQEYKCLIGLQKLAVEMPTKNPILSNLDITVLNKLMAQQKDKVI